VRYWGTEESVTQPLRSRKSVRPLRPRRQPTKRKNKGIKAKPSMTSGGSVKPFLRRFYRHEVVVSRPVQRVFLFLIVAGLFYAFVLGDGGIIRIAMLRHERAQLDAQIAELQRNTERLQHDIAHLRDDPFFIEKAGRELFGYVRPDEYVYKIVPSEDD
jgi:cell division protein FtsB